MAKTITQKFFIKPGQHIAVLHAPENYLSDTLTDLPEDVTISEATNGTFDSIQYFGTTKDTVVAAIGELKSSLKDTGVLWICYPKGGAKAKLPTDLNRDILWDALAEHGLKPNHIFSIDDTWSAMRFKVDR